MKRNGYFEYGYLKQYEKFNELNKFRFKKQNPDIIKKMEEYYGPIDLKNIGETAYYHGNTDDFLKYKLGTERLKPYILKVVRKRKIDKINQYGN